MSLPFKKATVDWIGVESSLGFSVNNNYKDFYSLLGAVGIDNFLFVVGINEEDGLVRQLEYTLDTYGELKEFLDEEIEIGSHWLPVGYTIDGAFLFCSEESVMITNGGFEDVELFNCSLLDFVKNVINNKVDSENLFDVDDRVVHDIVLLEKRKA